jgi:hypothetical protein
MRVMEEMPDALWLRGAPHEAHVASMASGIISMVFLLSLF